MAKFSSKDGTPSMVHALLHLVMLLAILKLTGAQSIGVCYGRNGSNLPPPQEVVDLYRQRNIGRMRIYDPFQPALQALRGSNIELILGVPNPDLQRVANDPGFANNWVQQNIRNYPDVRFKYIAVGNEVSPIREGQYAPFVLPAMRNIYNALAAAGLQDRIKVSTAIENGIITDSYPPSKGVFRPDVRDFITPIITFLVNNRSPILANVYPYFSFTGTPNLKLQYALFTNPNPEFTDPANNLRYQNLFDALVDSVYAALEKAGGAALEIVVSESGWPSAGGGAATSIDNARTYNQNLINHVRNGTPKKSGRPIETYIFAMFNEDGKKGPEFEKHFGLFYPPSKQPVYPINFA